MFEQAKRELDEAAAADVETLPAVVLGEEMRDLFEIETAARAQRLRRLDPFERAEGYVADGEVTAAAWQRTELGIEPAAASREVSAARVRRTCPTLAASFDAGRISFRHLQVAASALRRVPQPEIWSAVDAELAGWAECKNAAEFAEMVDELVQQVGPSPKPKDEEQHDKRRLSVTAGFDGMLNVHGRIHPEFGDKLQSALSAGSRPDVEGESRTPGQRKADALEQIVDLVLASELLPEDGGEKAHLTVTVDLDQLADPDADQGPPADSGPTRSWGPAAEQQGRRLAAGLAAAAAVDRRPRFAWTGPTGTSTVRRLSCDGVVIPIFTSGGQPLDVGRRTRVVSYRLRAAVVARDRHCRWGNCDRPARWCQAHHVRHWRDGGPTDRHNLILLCEKHHRAAHSGRFVVVLHGPGKITIRPRHGTEPLYEIRSPDPPPGRRFSVNDMLATAAAHLRAAG